MVFLDDLKVKARAFLNQPVKNKTLRGVYGLTQGVGKIVYPYFNTLRESGRQVGKLATSPTYRKAIFKPESLNQEEILKVNKPPATKYLTARQTQDRSSTIKTGAAATTKFGLGAIAAYNPATLLTTAGLAGGLTYGFGKVNQAFGGEAAKPEDIGRAIGESPVYAGLGKLTAPIGNVLGDYFSVGLKNKGVANAITRIIAKGIPIGGINVAENYLTTPILEERKPTKEENRLAFAIGMAGAAGDEAFKAVKNLAKDGLFKKNPNLDPQTADGIVKEYFRDKLGRFAKQALGLKGKYRDEVPLKKTEFVQVSEDKLVRRSELERYYTQLDEELNLPKDWDIKKIKLGLGVKDISDLSPKEQAKIRALQDQLPIPTGSKERGFIKTVKEAETTVPEVKAKVKGFYKPITNAETMQKAQFTIETEGWDAAKRLATSGDYTAENTAIGLELMRRAQDNGQFDEAIDIAQKLSVRGTQAGQNIQAFSMWGRMTPEGMLRYAQKLINKSQNEAGLATKVARKFFGSKAPKLTSDDAEQITKFMKKANSASSESEKAEYVQKAIEVINDKIPYGASELIDSYRYNNLLSNPLTQLRNFTSNAIQALFTRPITKAVAGDLEGSLKYYKGLYDSWGEAVDDAHKSFKGKYPIEKPDIKELRANKAPGFLTVPSRAMEASDKLFQRLISSGEIASGTGQAEAKQIAKYSLFRNALDPSNKTGQGKLLSAIDKATLGFNQFGKKVPLLRWFVPFIQTPMNVAKQWIEYSPAGLLTIPGASNTREQIAKTLIGSSIMAIAGKVAFDGNTTWSTPTDPTEKDLFYASGKKPYSIKVGDNWVPMQTAGIFAFPIALAAAAKHFQEDSRTALTDSQVEKLTKALFSQLDFFSQQTFMEGLGNFVNLAKGDQDYSIPGTLAYTSTQTIPYTGLLTYVTRVLDPVYRKIDAQSMFGKIKQTIQRGIPFASKSLTPYEKPGGETEVRNITDFIAPYAAGKEDKKYVPELRARSTKLQENAVINKEIKKYEDLNDKAKAAFERGNVEKARQILTENAETFRRGENLKALRSDVRKYQEFRTQASQDQSLTEEQRNKLILLIDNEITKRLNLIDRL